MNLTIDIGNTRTKIALFKDDNINELKIFKNESYINFCPGYFITHVGISSVVRPLTDKWVEICKKKLGVKPLIINNKIKLPLKLKVKQSYTLGSDRLCNAVWGYEYFGRKENVIIISFGTATTYDIVFKNGDYIGGMIIPGPILAARALHNFTNKLPFVKFGMNSKIKLYGDNTDSAIRSGIMNSTVFTANYFVKSINKLMRRKFKVILTGGFFDLLKHRFDFKYKHEENAVLKGINLLLSYNL